MDSNRIKELQEETAYTQSISVYKALMQVWNECQQEHNKQLRIANVRLSLPSANEQQKEAYEYGQIVSDTKERQIEASTDFFNGAAYIRICIDKGNEA